MGWEKRGNRSYLYRKIRIGKKVKTVYVGRSELAVCLDQLDQAEREKREIQSKRRKRERQKNELIDEKLNRLSEINKKLVEALFLINGFHQHKRQWRKKRKRKKKKD